LAAIKTPCSQIKLQQEQQLKAKHFAPPYSNDPEIFLLNIKREQRTETCTVTSYITNGDTNNNGMCS